MCICIKKESPEKEPIENQRICLIKRLTNFSFVEKKYVWIKFLFYTNLKLNKNEQF